MENAAEIGNTNIGSSEALAQSPQSVAAPAAAQPTGFDWSAHIQDQALLGTVNERGWKSPGDLLNSYRNLERLTGVPADRLVKLPTDANSEEWNQVYNKLGRPESPDKYQVPLPEGDDGQFAKTASKWFYEAGLSQHQAAKVSEHFNAYAQEALKAQQAAAEQKDQRELQLLKADWGDSYQANEALVDRAASAFGMTTDQLLALKQSMGAAAAMKFMANLGSKVAVEPGELVGHGTGGTNFGMSPDQAQQKIAMLRSDRSFAQRFTSEDPKVRGEAREEMARLHKIAFPAY